MPIRRTRLRTACAVAAVLALGVGAIWSQTVGGSIRVLDGDTIRVDGRTIRLVGIDAPETGDKARCETERILAARATVRLRELIALGPVALDVVACSCRPGTEGTRACNYGRACGRLMLEGRDLGGILIAEGGAALCVRGNTLSHARAVVLITARRTLTGWLAQANVKGPHSGPDQDTEAVREGEQKLAVTRLLSRYPRVCWDSSLAVEAAKTYRNNMSAW